MILGVKTLEKLGEIINGDNMANYRKGSELVKFFNRLGFNDKYGQGFPSRKTYTEDRLQRINGSPELDKCIRNAFAPIDFIGKIPELDSLISDFNQYLAFDKWQIIRDNDLITFKKLDKIIIEETNKNSNDMKEKEFLALTFNVDVDSLGLMPDVADIIKLRLSEIEVCTQNNAPLAAIILIGSVLEGILLNTATTYPQLFNKAQCAPKDKDNGKIRKFQDWTLNNYIDVAYEIGFLKEDVKKFSHVVRDFRNYIHPFQQMVSRFFPDKQTTLICFQVLKAVICQIGEYRRALQGGAN